MKLTLTTVMSWLVVAAGLYFGLGYLLNGDGAAAGFGIVDPTGYYVVKGVRDIAYALTALILLLMKQRRALGWVVLADAIIPIGDCLAVITHGGTVGYALAVHGSAAVLVLLTAGLLLRETMPARPQPVPAP
ncbi:protein of unknown function [Lentzea albidocapillata subsp. violacea]|uniref:DUF4267 domain-containing protein n=1 Tax=Lentzea albidocapillata subsp. violacea TaxID=128104 RepID=A0A1G9KHS5_9PSEU|nr:DUF4267 domain-containing protein [Lentzea albidocapillata]SDL49162.1 protein of unknown function [Lentzea albidocapillata subsp. violacea]